MASTRAWPCVSGPGDLPSPGISPPIAHAVLAVRHLSPTGNSCLRCRPVPTRPRGPRRPPARRRPCSPPGRANRRAARRGPRLRPPRGSGPPPFQRPGLPGSSPPAADDARRSFQSVLEHFDLGLVLQIPDIRQDGIPLPLLHESLPEASLHLIEGLGD